ncbi:MAG: hypothetical protein ABMB14_12050 [Myxococcota bacterium]
MTLRLSSWIPLVAGCAVGAPVALTRPTTPDLPGPRVHTITVAPDGSFAPQSLTIRHGDTVEWQLHDRADSIVSVDPGAPELCDAAIPYDPDDLTGPATGAAGGVFSLGPWDRGLEAVDADRCPYCATEVDPAGDCLCAVGRTGATMTSTWEDPALTGVMIRLAWRDLQIGPGTSDDRFDWTVLDREVRHAVEAGKLYSLTIKAGRDGTPDWLFDAGVDGLEFRDGGSDATGCGEWMKLGDPTDRAYRDRYFALWSAVSDHLRQRADWFRALAFVKPSGANLDSAENRLPNSCADGCPICSTETWAGHGYTPSGLYGFYDAQFELLSELFPGKPLSYELIGEGFPLVGESGSWLGMDPEPADLPGPAEQTDTILTHGTDALGERFFIQENGLSVEGEPPNGKVVQAGDDGFLTGFQTTNASGDRAGADPTDLDSALANAFDNSAAVFVEAYEDRLWEASAAGALPSGYTLAEWTARFQARLAADEEALVHRFTFDADDDAGRTFTYVHGAKCAESDGAWGEIVVVP